MDRDTSPSSLFAFTAWSWPVVTLRGITYRCSWTVLVIAVFGAVNCWHSHTPALIPLCWVGLLVAMAVHVLGHLAGMRWVRGNATTCTLCFLGDMTDWQLPLRAWPQFLVPAAGILASAGCWWSSWMGYQLLDQGGLGVPRILHWLPPVIIFPNLSPWTAAPLPYTLQAICEVSSALTLWNLVPNGLFDGARLWRGLLWHVLGLRRAMWWSSGGGLVCGGIIALLAINATDWLFLMFGLTIIITGVFEVRSLRTGWDLILETGVPQRRGHGGLFGRITAAWAERRALAQERAEAQEQEVLDQLLAKVSAQGLPALSERERATLARISKKQQRRQAGG